MFPATVALQSVPAGISALPPLIKKPNRQRKVKTIDKATWLSIWIAKEKETETETVLPG